MHYCQCCASRTDCRKENQKQDKGQKGHTSNTVGVEMEAPHVSVLLTIPHLPLLELRVKPEPEAAAVKVAHVPVVYQVPPLIIHPSAFPPVVTCSVPFPENGAPGVLVPVGPALVVVEVVVPPPLPLGSHFTPVAGQLDFAPSGFVGMKVPDCTEPLTS